MPFSHITARAAGLIAAAAALLLSPSCTDGGSMSNDYIAVNDDFSVTADSVTNGDCQAHAASPLEIVASGTIEQTDSVPASVDFRLWIDGRDNELPPGRTHRVAMGSDTTVTAGVEGSAPAAAAGTQRRVTLRADLSRMEQDFAEKGLHVTATGDTVWAHDFGGVWASCSLPGMQLSGLNATDRSGLKMHRVAGERGIYELTLGLPKEKKPSMQRSWSVKAVNSHYPTYQSGQMLVDALYNMAIDNIDHGLRQRQQNTELCYSVMLSLAYLAPHESMSLLKSMVSNGKIVQPGSGQLQWPVVSGGLAWTSAAWEVYNVTGDKAWLRYAYKVAAESVDAMSRVAFNSETGLMGGGAPYACTNAAYYPAWMNGKDLFESQSLYVNLMFQHTCHLLDEMGDELDTINDYGTLAERMKDALNHTLWSENRGQYVQYVYGGAHSVQSPYIDNMGQALSILWDLADDDRAQTLIEETPITNYGIPTLYPRQQGAGGSSAVHPLVQALWNLAAMKVGNDNMLRRGLGAMYRLQALSCHTSAMCNPATGLVTGCADPLSGAAGNAAMVFRVFAGMRFMPDGIEFDPMVPACFTGDKQIKGFKYRQATLDITIEGSGNDIDEMKIDGKATDDNFVTSDLTGHHTVTIRLKDSGAQSAKVTMDTRMAELPAAPAVLWDPQRCTIASMQPRLGYRMLINGRVAYTVTADTSFALPALPQQRVSTLCLAAVNKYGMGFTSRPYTYAPAVASAKAVEAVAGTTLVPPGRAAMLIETSATVNPTLKLTVDVDKAGTYAMYVRYANGDALGRCALRTVWANSHEQGTLVMPCRGRGQWMSTGQSSMVAVELLKGRNTLQLTITDPAMPGYSNCAALVGRVRVMPR